MFNKIETNKYNKKRIPLRTNEETLELLHNESKKENKSINFIMNEIIAKHYGLTLPQ